MFREHSSRSSLAIPAGMALSVLAAFAGCSTGTCPSCGGGRTPGTTAPRAAPKAADSGTGGVRPRATRLVPEVVSRPRPIRLAALVREPSPDNPAAVPSPAAQPWTIDLPAPPAPLAAVPAPVALLPATPAAPAAGEIRDMLRSYLRAFNQHDVAALAAHWSPAGESVILDTGDVTSGRAAVSEVFAALFAEDDEAAIDIDVTAIRPIRDDVAVVDGVTRVTFADGLPAGSRFSAVVVREGGRWFLDSVREATQPQEALAQRPLDELAWLEGSWEDAGAGVTAGTQCFWSTGRAFLVRTHSVRPDAVAEPTAQASRSGAPGLLPPGDASPRELTEIVGWDTDRGTIRSWLFTSTGRFAEATWTRQDGDGAWLIRVEGRGRDEGATCTCTLTADGAEGLVMTCDSDALAGLLPPACGFIRTGRRGAPVVR